MRHTTGGGTSRPGAKDESERNSRDALHTRREPIGAAMAVRGNALRCELQGHLAVSSKRRSGRGLWHEPAQVHKADRWGQSPAYPQDVLPNPGYSDSANRDDEILLA